jgi:hypothetical protein
MMKGASHTWLVRAGNAIEAYRIFLHEPGLPGKTCEMFYPCINHCYKFFFRTLKILNSNII